MSKKVLKNKLVPKELEKSLSKKTEKSIKKRELFHSLTLKQQTEKVYPVIQDITIQFDKLFNSLEKKHKIKIEHRSLIKFEIDIFYSVFCNLPFTFEFPAKTNSK